MKYIAHKVRIRMVNVYYVIIIETHTPMLTKIG
jgi:hypothetical protein